MTFGSLSAGRACGVSWCVMHAVSIERVEAVRVPDSAFMVESFNDYWVVLSWLVDEGHSVLTVAAFPICGVKP